jgi:hypothetical protein
VAFVIAIEHKLDRMCRVSDTTAYSYGQARPDDVEAWKLDGNQSRNSLDQFGTLVINICSFIRWWISHIRCLSCGILAHRAGIQAYPVVIITL